MTKVKKLYCSIHGKWYNPSKGLCPSCERGEPGIPIVDEIGKSQDRPSEAQANIFYLPVDSSEGFPMDPESLQLYQEQMRKNAEQAYRRIRLFRIIYFAIFIVSIVSFFVLTLL